MKTVIGISGPIGAGKDTFAHALGQAFVKRLFYHVEMSFADPIRRIAQRIGLDPFQRATKETPQVVECFGFKFAGLLRDELSALGMSDIVSARVFTATLKRLGVPASSLDAPITVSPRHFMQALGNGARDVNERFWIDALRARIKKSQAGVIIVSDVRFPNETHVVDELIYIARKGAGGGSGDVSEAHHEELKATAEWLVNNDGSLEDLDKTADEVGKALYDAWNKRYARRFDA